MACCLGASEDWDPDAFYAIRPESRNDVPKTHFKPRAGKTLSARRWHASFSKDGHLDIAKVLNRIQKGMAPVVGENVVPAPSNNSMAAGIVKLSGKKRAECWDHFDLIMKQDGKKGKIGLAKTFSLSGGDNKNEFGRRSYNYGGIRD